MKYLTACFLTVFIHLINGEPSDNWKHLPKDCGLNRFTKNDVGTRIVSGDEAKLGMVPWIAKLGKIITPTRKHFGCSGSLINRYYVISAAHCGEFIDFIRLGEHDTSKTKDCDSSGTCAPPYQDIAIKNIVFSDFCRVSTTQDLMLIEMKQPAVFNDFVQPICIHRTPVSPRQFEGKFATVSGWGRMDAVKTEVPDILLYVDLPIMRRSVCSQIFSRNLADDMICIGYPKGGKGACQGDSGGPATIRLEIDGVKREYLLGATSFSRNPCHNSPAIFTFIPYYMPELLPHITKS